MITDEQIAELEQLLERHGRLSADRPLPWTLWTSCSHRRIGSSAHHGTDGDVAYGRTHRDGCNDIVSREHDLALMVAAVNALPDLLALARAHIKHETPHA